MTKMNSPSTKECSHYDMKQITKRKQTKKSYSKLRQGIGIFQARAFLHSVSLTPYSIWLSSYSVFLFPFLFNVQVSLSTMYLHQSILSRASKVSPASTTEIYPARSTRPIIVIFVLLKVPTCHHVSRFPTSSHRRSLPFYICRVE